MGLDMRARVETWIREWWRNEHQRDFDALMRGGKLAGAALTGTIPSSVSVAWSSITGAPSFLSNPMTTQDDVIVGAAAGAPARLAKGSDSQVLTVDPSTHHLVWATPSGGMSNPMTTVGDLILGGTVTGGVAAPTRLAAGTSGYALVSNGAGAAPSYQVVGAGAGGALTLIGNQTLSGTAASVTFSSIPGSYRHLYLTALAWDNSGHALGNDSLWMQFNGDTNGNYDSMAFASWTAGTGNDTYAAGGTQLNVANVMMGGTVSPYALTAVWIDILEYTNTVSAKNVWARSARADAAGGLYVWKMSYGGWRTKTAAITQIVLLPSAGSFIAGCRFALYGVS